MSHSSASPGWDEARDRAARLGRVHPMPAIVVPIADAVGHRAATAASALVALPGADLSAMDGWAVCGDGPWVVGDALRMGAGIAPSALRAGHARPVTTGAVLPAGTTAVVRSEIGQESASADGTPMLQLTEAAVRAGEPCSGRHIRPAGEEVMAGEVLWSAGALITPAHVAFGAVAGLDDAAVLRRPRARLIVTGDEVVRSGVPRLGEVRDAYTPVFSRLLPQLGVELHSGRHAQDSHAAVSEALAHPDDVDLLITTGGTSRGSGDWVRRAVTDAGGAIIIDGVRMRPGHPVLLARLADGRPLLALPGNPLAALVCLLSFAPALVAGMTGVALGALSTLAEVDADPIERDTRVVPFRWESGRAVATSWRGAAMLRGLSEADGLAVVAPQEQPAPARLLPLPWRSPTGAAS